MSLYSLGAALLSITWLCVHLVLGGRDVLIPLLNTPNLDPVVRDTLYLCWHFVSATIAIMAGLFVWGSTSRNAAPVLAASIIAAGFAVTGITLVAVKGASHLQVPQGWLFLPVACLGFFSAWKK